MKIRPLHDRVIIKRTEVESKSAGGIVLTGSAAQKSTRGEVLAVGLLAATDYYLPIVGVNVDVSFSAIGCAYFVLMEIGSIIENIGAINPELLGPLNIALLSAFITPGKQPVHLTAFLPEIEAISRPKMQAHFRDTFTHRRSH